MLMIVDDFRTRLDAFFSSSPDNTKDKKKRIRDDDDDDDWEYVGYWYKEEKKNYMYIIHSVYIKINDDTTKQRIVMINYARIEGNERCWIVH